VGFGGSDRWQCRQQCYFVTNHVDISIELEVGCVPISSILFPNFYIRSPADRQRSSTPPPSTSVTAQMPGFRQESVTFPKLQLLSLSTNSIGGLQKSRNVSQLIFEPKIIPSPKIFMTIKILNKICR
jgi:hypothetical protein